MLLPHTSDNALTIFQSSLARSGRVTAVPRTHTHTHTRIDTHSHYIQTHMHTHTYTHIRHQHFPLIMSRKHDNYYELVIRPKNSALKLIRPLQEQVESATGYKISRSSPGLLCTALCVNVGCRLFCVGCPRQHHISTAGTLVIMVT